jgi:glucans biosynthesis protein
MRAKHATWFRAATQWAMAGFLAWSATHALAFDFNDVATRAKALASSNYEPPVDRLPRELRDMAHEQYRDIRFNPERAWWRADKLPFELQFFHPGRWFREPVRIYEVTPQAVKPIPFDPNYYDYGKNRIDTKTVKDVGHAGFRVHYAMNNPKVKDEVVVFLGASYFRAVGKGQVYGLSARGLAVDTAAPGGEEFPRFTDFWIERPRANATELVIYALMDSPRIAGAYRFVLKPGAETVVDVRTRLFPREAIDKVGIAALTSMYQYGENDPRWLRETRGDDYRPEVHDSDGLSVRTGDDEWIWRPLLNPQRLLVTSFGTTDPKGFGLMQRDRAFGSYEDLDARYERRPSAWVEPVGKWGEGRIELVQIPSPDETNDNIVAYWVPKTSPAPQKPFDLSYRLRWQLQNDTRPPTAWVVQSRRGRGFVSKPDGQLRFVIDFDGPSLRKLASTKTPQAKVNLSGAGELVDQQVTRNDANGGWRMSLRLKRTDATKPMELRAQLVDEQAVLTETWSYIVPPQQDKP